MDNQSSGELRELPPPLSPVSFSPDRVMDAVARGASDKQRGDGVPPMARESK